MWLKGFVLGCPEFSVHCLSPKAAPKLGWVNEKMLVMLQNKVIVMVFSLIAVALVSAYESEPVSHTVAPVGGGDSRLWYQRLRSLAPFS